MTQTRRDQSAMQQVLDCLMEGLEDDEDWEHLERGAQLLLKSVWREGMTAQELLSAVLAKGRGNPVF